MCEPRLIEYSTLNKYATESAKYRRECEIMGIFIPDSDTSNLHERMQRIYANAKTVASLLGDSYSEGTTPILELIRSDLLAVGCVLKD